jgi:hypothetical protein
MKRYCQTLTLVNDPELIEKYVEVHSHVWNYEEYNKSVGIEQKSVLRLMDSSLSGQSGLRSALVPTTIKFADENKNKYDSLGIFEVGRVWPELNENNLAVEKKKLAIVLASEKELGISDSHLGVMDLDKSYVIGENIKKYIPIDDIIIEIDNKSLTNRPDMWGNYGIA